MGTKGTLTLREHQFDELNKNKGFSKNSAGPLENPTYLVLHCSNDPNPISTRDARLSEHTPGHASCHLLVGETDDTTFQILPFDRAANHAGRSFYQGRSGLNQHSIAIEAVNGGPLTQGTDRKWRTASGYVIDEPRVIIGQNKQGLIRGYHSYSVEQLNRLEVLCIALLNSYKSLKEILTSDELGNPTLTGMGPAFPTERFKALAEERSWENHGAATLTQDANLLRNPHPLSGTFFRKDGETTIFDVQGGTKATVLQPGEYTLIQVAEGPFEGQTGFVHQAFLRRA